MFPILLSAGPFELRTMTIFVIIAFFLASFIFWRKCKEEHYREAEIFDGFLISAILGSLIARAVFILFNFKIIGFHVLSWFDFTKFPGINLIAGLAVAAFLLYKTAVRNKWDEFEILDFWVTGVALGLFVYYLGTFFDGTGYGYATNLPWGTVFPNLIEPHHPVQMYFALFYLSLYLYLSRVEYTYRTFFWYRHGKKTAQTGFLTAVFLIFVSVATLVLAIFKPATLEFMGINLDMVISGFMAVFGTVLLFIRSGRSLLIVHKKKTRPLHTKLEDLQD